MTDYLILENVRPYDGRYEMDMAAGFSTREWGWIKRLAGYHPLTVGDAYRNYDPEFWTVFAVILLRRAGKVDTRDVPDVYERLADEDYLRIITLEFGHAEPVEGDVDDPTESSNGNISTSGPNGTPSSESSEQPPSPTGMPGSATSGSAPTTSVT